MIIVLGPVESVTSTSSSPAPALCLWCFGLEMMLADQLYRTCLGALVPGRLIETHLVTYLQVIKALVDHAMAMKIDLATVICLDASEILLRVNGNDPAVWWSLMRLHLPLNFLTVMLQLSACSIKGISNRYVHLLMGMMLARVATDNELFTRHGDIDAGMEQVSLLMMLMMTLHNHATGHDQVWK